MICCLVAVAVARPKELGKDFTRGKSRGIGDGILRMDNTMNEDGVTKTFYPIQQDVIPTKNAQIGEEIGRMIYFDQNQAGNYGVNGRGENGVRQTYTVNRVADENDFQSDDIGDGNDGDTLLIWPDLAYPTWPDLTWTAFWQLSAARWQADDATICSLTVLLHFYLVCT